MKYNDAYKSSKNLRSEWYCHQALRALDQAADERYRRERNTSSMLKWLRKSIRGYDNFDSSLEGLKSFFSDVQERVSKNMVNVVDNSVTSFENIPSTVQNKGSTRKQDQNLNESDHCRQKEISLTKYNGNTFFPSLESQDDVELQASAQMEEDADKSPEFIDLSSPQKNSSKRLNLYYKLGANSHVPYGFIHGNETSASTVIHDFSGVRDQLSSHPLSVSYHNKNSSKAECFIVVTPQKNTAVNTSSSMVEMESSINLSVNSCSLKQRRFISSSPVICLIEEQHDAVDGDASDCATFIKDSTDNGDANQRADKCAEAKSKSSVPQLLSMNISLLKLPVLKILKLKNESKSKGIHVLVTDISSVRQQLCKRTLEGDSEHGTWSEKDGCVFNTIFCPFCGTDNNCLGVEVMATNASNIHLLNKILLYIDQLEIKNLEGSMYKDSKIKDPLPVSASSMDAVATLNSFDKFSYIPQENNSGGWITAKSKLRLPKRG
ncbi:hypothetical protein TorRG33x02_193320 [Trema orientale]|uniref:Uncharacterized protein n=1 Tax=Trema orientale TaxID=63057 RepID=A0A2P5EHF3_TREOI|nr:hypothetical protein TorRG33x02_193320 [Trema orientale]